MHDGDGCLSMSGLWSTDTRKRPEDKYSFAATATLLPDLVCAATPCAPRDSSRFRVHIWRLAWRAGDVRAVCDGAGDNVWGGPGLRVEQQLPPPPCPIRLPSGW